MLCPQKTFAGSGADDDQVLPVGKKPRETKGPIPSMRSSKRKSATAHAPAAKRHMRRQR
jgi:hypothetical protein